jgi:alpha-1,2-mannosyltransferase
MAATREGAVRVPRAPVRRTALQIAVVGAVAAAVAGYLVYLSPLWMWHGGFDLKVYRGAVLWWLDHKPLYAFHHNKTPYGFTYPPFAALTMLPMAWVSETTAQFIAFVASAAVVVGTTWWLVVPVAARHRWPRWFAVALAVPLVYLMEPVRETLAYGQVNLYLVALVLADAVLLARGSRLAGAGIGLATAIKLTPGLFIVYLLVTRRWRQAGLAIATFAAATLGTWALAPGTSSQFWTATLFDTSRVGREGSADNQSVLGLLTRLAGTGGWADRVWPLAAAVVLGIGLARARAAWRAGDELVGLTLTGLTSCLVSPISWTHHLYWVVPAVLVLVDVAAGTPVDRAPWGLGRRPRAGRALAAGGALAVSLIFGLSLVWFFAGFNGVLYWHGTFEALVSSAYALTMLVLLVLLPARHLGRRAAVGRTAAIPAAAPQA